LKQVKISVVDVSKKENLETVAEIRKVNPELPIVAFTDRNTPRLENFLRQVGIFFFFLKPFRIREMREILSLSLGEKES
jgi:AmiR/NasT family two-component response regulator